MYTCLSIGSDRPILDKTAIADIQRAIPAAIPHHVTKANMSIADISAAKRTNSRSPPRSKCGRLAD
jgi:hypothetical protein